MRLWDDIKWIFTPKRILPDECYRTPLEWSILEYHETLKRLGHVIDSYPRGPRGNPQNYTRMLVFHRLLAGGFKNEDG